MRLAWLALASLLFFSIIPVAEAQQQSAWTPRAIEALQSTASSKTGFSFDHWMLVLASKAVPGDDDLRRVIAGVSGLSVRIYRFQDAGYDLAALTSANDEYRAAGWQRVIEKHETSQGSGVTDVWVRMENNAIANAALLVARPNEVNFVSLSGSISPADLSHLCGHFGIPRIEGGITVPAPSIP